MSLFDLKSVHYDRHVFDLDPKRLAEHIETLVPEQRYLGLLASVVGAIVALAVGGLLFYLLLEMHTSSAFQYIPLHRLLSVLMFCGVGVLIGGTTGLTVRHAGRGIHPIFGITGAFLGLASCVFGLSVAVCWQLDASVSTAFDTGFTSSVWLASAEALRFGPFAAPVFAVLAGYKTAFRQLDDLALVRLQRSGEGPEQASE